MDAIDNLGDAIDVTRDRLTPVDAGTWVKLAIVIFFVGGATIGGTGVPFGDTGTTTTETEGVDSLEEFQAEWDAEMGDVVAFEELLVAIAVLVAILFVLWLVYAAIGAIMEFVFIESLRAESVHVRRYFNRNVGRGLRLLAFRIGVLLLFFLPLAVPAAFAVGTVDSITAPLAVLGLVYALLALLLVLLYSLLNRFTTVFVTQVMLLEGRGVVSAWKRFWPTLRGNLKEYAAYVVLIWILQFAVNFGYAFLAALVAFAVIVPFAILIALLVVVGGAAVYGAVAVGLVGLVCLLLAVMLVRVPIDSYFRYYEFLLLGDTNADLDLIPDRRAAARADTEAGIGQVPADPDDGTDDWGRRDDPAAGGREDSDGIDGPEADPDADRDRDEWDTSSRWDRDDETDARDGDDSQDVDDDDPRRGW